MIRNPKTDPLKGDIFSMSMSRWEVVDIDGDNIRVKRDGYMTTKLSLANFRQCFAKSNVVQWGA